MAKSRKPSRANGRENKLIRSFLEKRCRSRYGKLLCEVCLGADCGCKDDKSSENKLINEHIDGNSNNWDPANLRLSSQSCNVREWHKKRDKVGVDNKRERERGKGKETLIKQMLKDSDLRIDTLSMFKATYYKSEVHEYTRKEMLKSPVEGCLLKELANDCSNLFGLSVAKAEEYILSKTYKTGEYSTEMRDGQKYLIWKLRYLESLYDNEIKKFTD
jgi:hypothetical protein